jgi:hypothetical protein
MLVSYASQLTMLWCCELSLNSNCSIETDWYIEDSIYFGADLIIRITNNYKASMTTDIIVNRIVRGMLKI